MGWLAISWPSTDTLRVFHLEKEGQHSSVGVYLDPVSFQDVITRVVNTYAFTSSKSGLCPSKEQKTLEEHDWWACWTINYSMESMTYIQFPFPCLIVQLLPEPIVRCAIIFPLSCAWGHKSWMPGAVVVRNERAIEAALWGPTLLFQIMGPSAF